LGRPFAPIIDVAMDVVANDTRITFDTTAGSVSTDPFQMVLPRV
jgi:hypothetical protein